MKYYGPIVDPKILVTKEYVDGLIGQGFDPIYITYDEWIALTDEERADNWYIISDYPGVGGSGGGGGGGSTGGHVIVSPSGTQLPKRKYLKFNNSTVTDDASNDTTVVTPSGGGGEGEVYTPEIGTVSTLDPGQSATASIDLDTTNYVATYNFGIPKGDKGDKGDQGNPGQNGTNGRDGTDGRDGADGVTPSISATASVDNNSGIPSVQVTKSGTDTNPSFAFAFHNLKGSSSSVNYTDEVGSFGFEIGKITIDGTNNPIRIPFELGIDSDGNYGYIKRGTSEVIPFSNIPVNPVNTSRLNLYIIDEEGPTPPIPTTRIEFSINPTPHPDSSSWGYETLAILPDSWTRNISIHVEGSASLISGHSEGRVSVDVSDSSTAPGYTLFFKLVNSSNQGEFSYTEDTSLPGTSEYKYIILVHKELNFSGPVTGYIELRS